MSSTTAPQRRGTLRNNHGQRLGIRSGSVIRSAFNSSKFNSNKAVATLTKYVKHGLAASKNRKNTNITNALGRIHNPRKLNNN